MRFVIGLILMVLGAVFSYETSTVGALWLVGGPGYCLFLVPSAPEQHTGEVETGGAREA